MATLTWWCVAAASFLSVVKCAPQVGGLEHTHREAATSRDISEEDAMLTSEQQRPVEERKAIAGTRHHWPPGPDGWPLVPYIFVNISLSRRKLISEGLNHWMKHTCIKFKETTNTSGPHLRFIDGPKCWSHVGLVSRTGQDISLGSCCQELGTVIQQVGHALGLNHEHSRPDRDDHIHVNTENIIPDKLGRFKKLTEKVINTYGVPYDFTSIMHYASRAFSRKGRLTIATKNLLYQGLLGQRDGLSHRDKLLVNRMYNCTGKWLKNYGLCIDPCENEGYTGANSTCICRHGTSGEHCELVTGGYYGFINTTNYRGFISVNTPRGFINKDSLTGSKSAVSHEESGGLRAIHK
ncbi:protein SpAN-like [Homarus americanus]|uniref:protein SpAN-like n=1 Tax=Homarus americanus TaxID=6706 RepID=UPI001C47E05A|nr:protein SpAN-like [Homarus americanus]